MKRHSAAVIQNFHLLQREHDDRQSIQFLDKQIAVNQRIQEEAVETFVQHSEVKALSAFLRLGGDPNGKNRNKAYLGKMNTMLQELFVRIKEKQKLSDDELNSLKKVIFNRVGVGIEYESSLSWLPSFLFMPIYYLLSPQQVRVIRKYGAALYHYFARRRHFIK